MIQPENPSEASWSAPRLRPIGGVRSSEAGWKTGGLGEQTLTVFPYGPTTYYAPVGPAS